MTFRQFAYNAKKRERGEKLRQQESLVPMNHEQYRGG